MKRTNEEFKACVIMCRGQIINQSQVDCCIISKWQNQIKDPLTRNTREYRYRASHLTNLCSALLATPGIDPPRDRRPICHVDRIAYYTRISTCYAGIVIKYRRHPRYVYCLMERRESMRELARIHGSRPIISFHVSSVRKLTKW